MDTGHGMAFDVSLPRIHIAAATINHRPMPASESFADRFCLKIPRGADLRKVERAAKCVHYADSCDFGNSSRRRGEERVGLRKIEEPEDFRKSVF